MSPINQKTIKRTTRRKRIRARISGTAEAPRLSVFRSNKAIYAQVIDDVAGKTLVAASTNEEELRAKSKLNIEGAKAVGEMVAKRALAKNVKSVVFDRGGYLYHGRVKALADAAREAGLNF